MFLQFSPGQEVAFPAILGGPLSQLRAGLCHPKAERLSKQPCSRVPVARIPPSALIYLLSLFLHTDALGSVALPRCSWSLPFHPCWSSAWFQCDVAHGGKGAVDFAGFFYFPISFSGLTVC